MSFTPLPREFYRTTPLDCARQLIGMMLVWNGCTGRIVETEAYDVADDPACHTFFRRSARRFVEEQSAGAAYIYLNYGVHWMANVLVKGERTGFVLIRALEPIQGIRTMQRRRRQEKLEALCSGPGKLTQALGITGASHGADYHRSKRRCLASGEPSTRIDTDVRIGISRGQELPWRFLEAGNPHISVKPKRAWGQTEKTNPGGKPRVGLD